MQPMRYYPFLRGRQNELIAIRELSTRRLLQYVIPVIEPVKASSTLLKTLHELVESNSECYVVRNPIVGVFERESLMSPSFSEEFNSLFKMYPKSIHSCLYLSDNFPDGCEQLKDTGDAPAVIFDKDHEELLRAVLDGGATPALTFVEDRFRRHVKRGDKVLLEDRFRAQEKNADYRKQKDEFFSDDYLYCSEEGYFGFGDYSIVGRRYSESGFRPRAVALHCVYESQSSGELRVHHAVSSESAFNDVASLFGDALDSLINWADETGLLDKPTVGLSELKEIRDEGTFPGLGMAKRLTIMHHLELVNRLLEERL